MRDDETKIMAIDAKVKALRAKNTDDMMLLTEMIDEMLFFREIMENSKPEQLNAYCQKYTNFFYFAKLLENLADTLANAKA
ncbi:hypothetical protein [Facilibium subflavum]|uniref:hypothetical protein n=1 Tax=Facilibium subflavum TaxID=2219058 RepID=UPI000E64DE71|nr:hypothetical protein [Facilibium subflavum]